MIYGNIGKIVQMAKKKNRIKPEHEEIIISDHYPELGKLIYKEVMTFAREVSSCKEGEDFDVQMCLLRMLNAVLILAQLQGKEASPIVDIDSLPSSQVKP